MKIEYIKIESLEEIIDQASKEIPHDNYTINHILSFAIPVKTITEKPLLDVANEASLWASKECPNELHINHGQYIGNGLDHIISELTHKRTSNRALFSLIDQSTISESGDNPIPSFMIMQCALHQEVLYCTSYFRALEVTTFLRINIEEIRQKIQKIYESIPHFKTVNLTIFAFRAYSNENINTLKIPELDRTPEAMIMKLLGREPRKIAELLKEKCKDSTIVVTTSTERIISCLNVLEDSEVKFNRLQALHLAKEALDTAHNLKQRRASNSHHEDLGELNKALQEKTQRLAEVIQNA
ncbi:hypothetical protein D9M68_570740 [compost metagenome]